MTYMCCPHCGDTVQEFCEPADVHVNPCPEPCCDEGTVEIGEHVVLWPRFPGDEGLHVTIEYGPDGIFKIGAL